MLDCNYIIQHICFPKESVCSEEKLYFHVTSKMAWYDVIHNRFQIMPKQTVSFLTYYNTFPLAKWKRYCGLQSLIIRFTLEGSGLIEIIQGRWDEDQKRTSTKAVLTFPFQCDQRCTFELKPPINGDGLTLAYRISSEEIVYLYQVDYVMEDGSRNASPVRLGLNLCTRNRDAYLERNLRNISTYYFGGSRNSTSPVIVITNNGKMFKPKGLDLSDFIIQDGRESGSAGGFGYGCQTIMKISREYKITHCIFMDDDIILDPEVLERLSQFIRWILPIYHEYTIGGALMYIDEPYIQHEAGALWNAGCIQSIKPMLDMREENNVIWNEVEEKTEYMGWWFCCVPLECIRKRGFPFAPLYFHRDDVEFGLRNPAQLTLTGIAVWHESFSWKTDCTERYYNTRNMAIVNALHRDQNWKVFYCFCCKAIRKELMRHRYRYAALVIQGAEDFCMGREWIGNHNDSRFFNSITTQAYLDEPVERISRRLKQLPDMRAQPRWPRWKRILMTYIFLNGLFFPWKKEKIVSYSNPPAQELFHTNCTYSLHPNGDKYFVNRFDGKKLINSIHDLLRLGTILKHHYSACCIEWKEYFKDSYSMQ